MCCVVCEVKTETYGSKLNPLCIIRIGLILVSKGVILRTLLQRNCFSAAFCIKTERAVIFAATKRTVTTNQYRKPQKKYNVDLA
jgi:hypothetical protein